MLSTDSAKFTAAQDVFQSCKLHPVVIGHCLESFDGWGMLVIRLLSRYQKKKPKLFALRTKLGNSK